LANGVFGVAPSDLCGLAGVLEALTSVLANRLEEYVRVGVAVEEPHVDEPLRSVDVCAGDGSAVSIVQPPARKPAGGRGCSGDVSSS
jgi:hypothetical protein